MAVRDYAPASGHGSLSNTPLRAAIRNTSFPLIEAACSNHAVVAYSGELTDRGIGDACYAFGAARHVNRAHSSPPRGCGILVDASGFHPDEPSSILGARARLPSSTG